MIKRNKEQHFIKTMTKQDQNRPESNMSFDKVADVLKWLGHPDRLAAIKLLSEKSDLTMSLVDITNVLDLTAATSSRHMSILRKIGLVERLNFGQEVSYKLDVNDTRVEQILKLINADHRLNDPFSGLRP